MKFCKNSIHLIFLAFFLIQIEACKIQIKIKSQTLNEFQIQVFIPSIKQKTERVTFNTKEEKIIKVYSSKIEFLFQIIGENCLNKKWVVRTWKPDGNGNWIGAKQESAKIDGNGWLRIIIDDSLRPMMTDRYAIFCSEGGLCG